MLKLLYRIDKTEHFQVACSGGVDSMSLLHLYRSFNMNVGCIHFNHGTDFSKDAEKLVKDYCKFYKIPMSTFYIRDIFTDKGKEFGWAKARHEIMNSFPNKIVLAHHLDDCVEKFIISTLKNAEPSYYNILENNLVRPLLTTSKEKIIKYAKNKNVPYLNDPSNFDNSNARSIIRNNIKVFEKINPGIRKLIAKKVKENVENV